MDTQLSMERLRDLREKKGLSQEKLASIARVGKATVQRLENVPNQWSRVTDSSLSKLSRALGVPKEYLVSDIQIDAETIPTPSSHRNSIKMTSPIKRDSDDIPRMAHVREDWNEQGLCFLEEVRQAYWDWADSDDLSFDRLQEYVDDALSFWAEQHDIDPEGRPHEDASGDGDYDEDDAVNDRHHDADLSAHEDVFIINADTPLYKKVEHLMGADQWIEKVGTAEELIRPNSSVETIRVVNFDGERYDVVRVLNGRNKTTYWIKCHHRTRSKNTDDHPVELSASFYPTRTAVAR